MGIKLFSSSSGDKSSSMFSHWLSGSKNDKNIIVKEIVKKVKKSLPNPDPKNYEIQSHYEIGDFLIIQIKYLDCINYEGVKILVFKTTMEKLMAQKNIDPHFCDNKKFISPIARFEPTQEGWDDAINFVKFKMELNKL